jgi:hypothetical protein
MIADIILFIFITIAAIIATVCIFLIAIIIKIELTPGSNKKSNTEDT